MPSNGIAHEYTADRNAAAAFLVGFLCVVRMWKVAGLPDLFAFEMDGWKIDTAIQIKYAATSSSVIYSAVRVNFLKPFVLPLAVMDIHAIVEQIHGTFIP